MASLTLVRMKKNNIKYIPELYTIYTIVYIQDEDYAYDIGGETGSKYFILNDGKIYGQIHGKSSIHIKLIDIDSQLNSNDELKNSLLVLPKYTVVKVGEFEVIKIKIYGEYTLKFNMRGLPRLFNLYITDHETLRIQSTY
jgi:hypothetical protein